MAPLNRPGSIHLLRLSQAWNLHSNKRDCLIKGLKSVSDGQHLRLLRREPCAILEMVRKLFYAWSPKGGRYFM